MKNRRNGENDDLEFAWVMPGLEDLVATALNDLDYNDLDEVSVWLSQVQPMLLNRESRSSLKPLIEKLRRLGYTGETKVPFMAGKDIDEQREIVVNCALSHLVKTGRINPYHVDILTGWPWMEREKIAEMLNSPDS